MFPTFVFSLQHFLLLWMVLLIWGQNVEGAPADAEVKQFPGYNGLLPSKHYAGYITVGEQVHKRHLYYYFATSERNPSKDPVTFYVNGGPGCSGISGLIHLLGPFKIEYDFIHTHGQAKIIVNPFSWTKVSSVLFVDSPAGAGYSYSDTTEDYMTNDSKTILDLYEFILKWFSEYPEFLSNPLYLAGCSYSGLFVPVLAQEMVNGIESGNEPILNFKGYSLGNAAIDIDIENNAMVPFAYRMGLISDELYMDLTTSCSGKFWNNSHTDCLRNLETFQMHIEGINTYHILCLPCHYEMGISMEANEYDSVMMYRSLHDKSQDSIYCYNYNMIPERVFDLQSSRQSLHAMPVEVSGQWKRCTNRLHYERDILSVISYHMNLTMKGYRAFIYSGDHDMMVPYTATLEWIKMLNYSEIEKWHPWFVEDQIAGYTVRYDHNLLFATFKGAGHTVTEYMPREGLIAYKRWIDGADSL